MLVTCIQITCNLFVHVDSLRKLLPPLPSPPTPLPKAELAFGIHKKEKKIRKPKQQQRKRKSWNFWCELVWKRHQKVPCLLRPVVQAAHYPPFSSSQSHASAKDMGDPSKQQFWNNLLGQLLLNVSLTSECLFSPCWTKQCCCYLQETITIKERFVRKNWNKVVVCWGFLHPV